jgi:hypothetical protein
MKVIEYPATNHSDISAKGFLRMSISLKAYRMVFGDMETSSLLQKDGTMS